MKVKGRFVRSDAGSSSIMKKWLGRPIGGAKPGWSAYDFSKLSDPSESMKKAAADLKKAGYEFKTGAQMLMVKAHLITARTYGHEIDLAFERFIKSVVAVLNQKGFTSKSKRTARLGATVKIASGDSYTWVDVVHEDDFIVVSPARKARRFPVKAVTAEDVATAIVSFMEKKQ